MLERIETSSTEQTSRRYRVFFWLSVSVMFFIANIGAEKYRTALMSLVTSIKPLLDPRALENLNGFFQQYGEEYVLSKASEYLIVPGKATFFLLALVIIAFPVARSAFAYIRDRFVPGDERTARYVFFLLFLFVFVLGTQSMGHRYQEMSLSPFDVETNVYYRRLLFSALSYYLHINGLFYTIFFWMAVYLLIRLCLHWFREQGKPLTIFEALSMFTAGIVIFQYQYPGYVEFFVFILLLLSILLPLSAYQRMSLFALMLLTHEAATVAMMIPVIAFLYPRREWPGYVVLVILYAFFYLLNFGFDIHALLSAQTQLGGTSALEHFYERPYLVLLGILVAYKAVWLYLPVALYFLLREQQYRGVAAIVSIVALPLFLLPLGIDTSRLAAFGFYGLMLAYVMANRHIRPAYNNAILWVNILIPSVYVGLHLESSAKWFPGLYQIYPSLWP